MRRRGIWPADCGTTILNATLLLLALVFFSLIGCRAGTKHNSEPNISFNQVPEWSLGDENLQDVMEGTVSGARQGQRLVIYTKTGNLWWVQPLVSSPFTSIASDHVWRNEVHLGTDYAVLLVDPSYDPPAVLAQLPNPGQGVSAIGVSHGQKHSSSFFVDISRSGFEDLTFASDPDVASHPVGERYNLLIAQLRTHLLDYFAVL